MLGHNRREIRKKLGGCIIGETKGRWQLVVREIKTNRIGGRGLFVN